MFARLRFCSLGIAFLSLSFFDIAQANQFVVWRTGDSATYRDTSTGREIRAEVDQGWFHWNHYTNFAGLGPLWIISSSRDDCVYVYAPDVGNFQLLADFSAPLGSTTSLDLGPCNYGTARLAAREALTVPAGSFADVLRIDFETSCADAGVTSAWFARGVGPIQWTTTTIAGPSTHQMVSANIGGTLYPKHSGIAVIGEFPERIYWIDMMPGAAGPAPSVNVFLTIQNNTRDDLTYSFSSGQHFEIEVIDTEGQSVSKWSRGKAFTQAFSEVTILPGEGQRFGGSVELIDESGLALPQGEYSLKIYLTCVSPTGVPPPQAAAPIEVRWAF